MNRLVCSSFAALLVLLVASCGKPDQRMVKAIDTLEQVNRIEEQNKDRIWQSLLANWRAGQEAKVNAAYKRSQEKAAANMPTTADYPNDLEGYAEALGKYMEKHQRYLLSEEQKRQAKLAKIDVMAAQYQDAYEATKQNNAAQKRLTELLREYEMAKIDPTEALKQAEPVIKEIVELSQDL